MSTALPSARLDLGEHTAKAYAAMMRLEAAIELDPAIRHLVKLRASQLNGCAYCIDMHWKDARADGEPEARLYGLDAWRETPLYDDREQAALELCEAVTMVADTHVPDEVWQRAQAQFDERELAHLVFAITAINAWNRLAITARSEPGHYEPGALHAAG
jgi:AhpD family alkylhydroperoxidase